MNKEEINSQLPFGEFGPEKGFNKVDGDEVKVAIDRAENGRLEWHADEGKFIASIRRKPLKLEVSEEVAKFILFYNVDDTGYWQEVRG